ncbi:hypothetical protein D9758_002216 [Tetrapyrgos nigripes]|uniref:Bromo domain-containing protein n=1 Tax=Tetrapyrgos nigripes TaxID=182062 RepID=A0A8H5LT03_9AGAR|nr:hypothetical protein D9758_002216 [Tetrapyrgos nigripes]
MPKRERGPSDGGEESRTKRKRENGGSSSDVEMAGVETTGEGASGESVTEQGLKLWQTVKDGVNKEERPLSLLFLTKPSKKLYPDYYRIIAQPIALDDIKKKLQSGTYPTLEAVRQDFELCFTNAKTYNAKGSEIYQDAKDLLKLTNKTYKKLVPSEENAEGSKNKPPNIHRMMKSRLQKLIDKTDEGGRVLSSEFMELPNKKTWAIYYSTIKRPQCLENIFKHVKRKEYSSLSEFAENMELVFSNAMSFNQEHTQIWEDALSLRDYFRQLMSDLPEPFALPQYSKPSNKIKIKMPAAAQSNTAATDQSAKLSGTAINIRVPPVAKPTTASSSKETIAPTPTAQVSTPTPIAQPQPVATPAVRHLQISQPTLPAAAPSVAPVTHQSTPSHIPSAPTISQPISFTSNNLKTEASRQTVSVSPAPPPAENQIRCVMLVTEPRGRPLNLDHRDGVTSWAMRLGKEEKSLLIRNIAFLGDEDEDSSGAEDDGEEDDVKEDTDAEANTKSVKRKSKRGRGRAMKVTRSTTRLKANLPAKKKVKKIGEIQVKLNGSVLQEQDGQSGKWTAELVTGSNTLEVGEKGGLIWKIYAERVA